MAKDKHDPRDFEQFVKLNDDGTVAAVVQRETGAAEPTDDPSVFLKVEHLGAMAFDAVTVDPNLIAVLKQTRNELAEAASQHARAVADHATATQAVHSAFTTAAVTSRG